MTSTEVPAGYRRAAGPFDVTMDAQPPYDTAEGVTLGRVTFHKTFHGDLEATSVVEMLSAMTSVEGSAGYVALERVTSTLHGRTGSFVLQHTGTMTRGEPQLSVMVVPDSGSRELKGLAGRMSIDIDDEGHRFTLQYRLDDGA